MTVTRRCYIELLAKVDQLIDIVNTNRMRNGKEKGCTLIDSPEHGHISERLGIVKFFEDWRKECGKSKDKFIPVTTHEDMCWTCLGLIGIACTYLKKDKSIAMYQAHSGTNCCKIDFANLRAHNSNPNLLDVNLHSAKMSSGIQSNMFKIKIKANAGRSSLPKPEEYMDKLYRK